jgi:hypothetical protein
MSKSKKLTEGGEGGGGGGGGGGGNGENFLNCNPTKLLKKLDTCLLKLV